MILFCLVGFFGVFVCFMALPLCIFLFHLKKREEDDLFAGFSYFRNGFLFKKKIFLMLFCLMGFGFHCLSF